MDDSGDRAGGGRGGVRGDRGDRTAAGKGGLRAAYPSPARAASIRSRKRGRRTTARASTAAQPMKSRISGSGEGLRKGSSRAARGVTAGALAHQIFEFRAGHYVAPFRTRSFANSSARLFRARNRYVFTVP